MASIGLDFPGGAAGLAFIALGVAALLLCIIFDLMTPREED